MEPEFTGTFTSSPSSLCHHIELFVLIRLKIEGIHKWEQCDIPEVSYLRNPHRHMFNIIGKAIVGHTNRDIEFIKLSHEIKQYVYEKYFDITYNCCLFGNMSCEDIALEILNRFNLMECEVNEDGEGGSVVQRRLV
ncbi:MAG: hypothetical protein ACXW2E_00425 [Nitrososphaeraceae archaeon]